MGLVSVHLPRASLSLVATLAVGCGGSDTSSLFSSTAPSGTGGGFQLPGAGGGSGEGGSLGIGGASGFGGFGLAGGSLGAGGIGTGATSGAGGLMSDGGADAGDPLAALPPALRALAKCSFTGTWGTFVTVPVNWPGAPFVLLEGQGTIKQWTLSHRVQDSLLAIHETVSACSIFLPDLQGSLLANNQKYGIRFPNDIFDFGVAPPYLFHTVASVVSDHVEFDTEPVVTLTGFTMPSPMDPWPSPPPSSQFRDDDRDGLPGVTVLPVDPGTDPAYNFPPVGIPPQFFADYPRARLISIISRSVAKLHGTVTSCDELDGDVEIQTISGTPAINSTVIGCTRTDGQVCVQSEADFLNQNRPQFSPTGLGQMKSVRMPDGATCADVRAKFP